MTAEKSLGQVLYEQRAMKYSDPWDEILPVYREPWETSAQAVIAEHERRKAAEQAQAADPLPVVGAGWELVDACEKALKDIAFSAATHGCGAVTVAIHSKAHNALALIAAARKRGGV